MNYKLLCTFSNKDLFISTVKNIIDTYEIPYKKIYIYENSERPIELFFTYNISTVLPSRTFLKNTILIHRKKESNTIYTINALNELIKEINNNILDISYRIEWSNYQDMAILSAENSFRKIRLNLKEIFDLAKKNQIC